MRKQYAEAIRVGIQKAKLTNFGDINDQFYEIRGDLIYPIVFSHSNAKKCRGLSLEAFNRTAKKMRDEKIKNMSIEEYKEASKNFKRAHLLYTETREEREYRLLREEVQTMREELNDALDKLDMNL